MGWSNQQATTLDGQAFTYTNSTIEYATGSALTVDADAALNIAPGVLDPLDLVGNTLGYARYTASVPQTINNAADTYVAFPDERQASSLVTKAVSGVGNYFWLEVSGIWTITSTVRFVSGGGNGERYAALQSNNYGAQQVIAATGGYDSSEPGTMCLSYTGYFPDGSWILTSVFHNSGASLDLEGALQWKNINLCLIRRYPA